MPLYEYECPKCRKALEIIALMNARPPECCGLPMERKYSGGKVVIKDGVPLFVRRMEEIHKAQEQRGERFRMIHPREVVK